MSGPSREATFGSGVSAGAGGDCDLRFDTNLRSPRAEVVKTLSVDDELAVMFDAEGPAVYAQKQTDIAGAIVGSPALIDCLMRGFDYTATVLLIDGGNVPVRVQRK